VIVRSVDGAKAHAEVDEHHVASSCWLPMLIAAAPEAAMGFAKNPSSALPA
jgi:hypothetical protein